MARELSLDSLESLRVAFLKLEHAGSDCDAIAVAHFKSLALSRLADLEAELAIIENLAADSADVELPVGSSLAKLQDLEGATQKILPRKPR
jgi:hypothetical protein